MNFTERQIKKARHALGLDNGKRAYRNRYIVYVSDSDWEDLVTKTMAEKHIDGNTIWYSVTKKFSKILLKKNETTDADLFQ